MAFDLVVWTGRRAGAEHGFVAAFSPGISRLDRYNKRASYVLDLFLLHLLVLRVLLDRVTVRGAACRQRRLLDAPPVKVERVRVSLEENLGDGRACPEAQRAAGAGGEAWTH